MCHSTSWASSARTAHPTTRAASPSTATRRAGRRPHGQPDQAPAPAPCQAAPAHAQGRRGRLCRGGSPHFGWCVLAQPPRASGFEVISRPPPAVMYETSVLSLLAFWAMASNARACGRVPRGSRHRWCEGAVHCATMWKEHLPDMAPLRHGSVRCSLVVLWCAWRHGVCTTTLSVQSGGPDCGVTWHEAVAISGN